MKSAAKDFSKHKEAIAADWQNIKNVFADTTADVTEMADDMCSHAINNLKNQSGGIQKHVTDYTVRNPMHALGITLLAGIVIGWWLKR